MYIKIRKDFLFFYFTCIYFIYAALSGVVIEKKSIISVIMGSGFFFYSLFIVLNKQSYVRMNVILIIYICYLFLLISFSSRYFYSLKLFMKAATPMLYFIVAIIYVKDYDDFQKLNRTSIWLIVLFILNILIANIFDLGKIQYKDEETLDVGNIYTTGLNSMAYILILAPYYILVYKFKNKFTMILYFTTAFTAFVIMVILMKRASLLALFVGYLILFLTFDFKNKTKLLGILSIFTLTIILTFPLYRNLVLERYEARMNRMQLESYESEGRYLENKYVLDEIFSFQDLKYSFLGREMFNSPGNYANGRFGRRQLHNDYSRLLNGSGLIGLLFHFIMNFSILMIFIKLKVKLKKNKQWERNEKILN